MRLHSYSIVYLTILAALMSDGVFVSAAGLPKPSMAPPFVRQPQRSPIEIMAETKKKLDAAIKKRQKRGLPVDPDNVRLVDPLYAYYHAPTRNYTKQSCYHMTQDKDPDNFIFCNADRCTFPEGDYCQHKSRDCYDADGKLILDKKGLSAIDNKDAVFIKWDLCLEKDGAPVVISGEKSFDEKIKTGCGYRVGKKIHPYLVGYIGYMMTCDTYRCIFHPSGMVYNRETKLFRTSQEETKTPPNEYYPYLDWKCLNWKQANRVARKYRCSLVTEDKRNWGCEVCSENGKHLYTNCRYKYNEKSEIVGMRVPLSEALEDQLEELEYASDEFEQNPKTYHIVKAMSDIMMPLLRTPTSDAAQGKIVALFESFFSRKSEESWSNTKLSQELATLRNKIRRAMKK